MTEPLALFGGTFDPVHWGHIRTANALREELGIAQIRFVVSARPPHRAVPVASAEQRLTMVELALREQPGLSADRRELDRPGPSYTLWTLRQLRAEAGERPLLWIVGADSLATLTTWFHWWALPCLAHWVVLPRPGSDVVVPPGLAERRVSDPRRLWRRSAGLVYVARTPEVAVSASEVRARLAAGEDLQTLIPAPVLAYIEVNGLYRDHDNIRGVHAV